MTLLIRRLCEVPEFTSLCWDWDLATWPRTPENEAFFINHYPDAVMAQAHELPQTWLAFHQGQPVGMVSLLEKDHPDFLHLSPWLAAAFILPDYRGRGIFQNLMEALLQHSEQQNRFQKIYAYSYMNFEQWGWQREQKIIDPFERGKEISIFSFDLTTIPSMK